MHACVHARLSKSSHSCAAHIAQGLLLLHMAGSTHASLLCAWAAVPPTAAAPTGVSTAAPHQLQGVLCGVLILQAASTATFLQLPNCAALSRQLAFIDCRVTHRWEYGAPARGRDGWLRNHHLRSIHRLRQGHPWLLPMLLRLDRHARCQSGPVCHCFAERRGILEDCCADEPRGTRMLICLLDTRVAAN